VLARVDREAVAGLREELAAALADDPPKTLRQGGLLRGGYDDALDELLAEHREHEQWLDGLADRERERLGVAHLQVDRNKTDGYYLQVGRSETDAVPDDYREVKTLKNSKRYTTEELETRERHILRVEEERGDLEYRLFCDLRERVGGTPNCSRTRAGRSRNWTRSRASPNTPPRTAGRAPNSSRVTTWRYGGGRHPVVEQSTEFVPNDAGFGRADGSSSSRDRT